MKFPNDIMESALYDICAFVKAFSGLTCSLPDTSQLVNKVVRANFS